MDILNGIEADSTFTAADVLEQHINGLIARMYTFQQLQDNDEVDKLVESWRRDLVVLRRAIREVLSEDVSDVNEKEG